MLWCSSKLGRFTTAQITARRNTSDKRNKTETMLLIQWGARLSCVAVELVCCIFSPLHILVLRPPSRTSIKKIDVFSPISPAKTTTLIRVLKLHIVSVLNVELLFRCLCFHRENCVIYTFSGFEVPLRAMAESVPMFLLGLKSSFPSHSHLQSPANKSQQSPHEISTNFL